VFATSERTAPGFRALNRALLSIAPVTPRHYVPVPHEARLRAYAASPAFNELKPYLEGPAGAVWRHSAMAATDSTDLAGEWLPLAVRDAVRRAGHAATAADAERFYQRAAGELRAACRDGRLKCRAVIHPYLAPDLADVGRRSASSGAVLVSKLFWPWTPSRQRDDPFDDSEVAPLFDRVANRRAHLVDWPWANVSGWAFSTGDPLVSVTVRDRAHRVRVSSENISDRPDVVTHFPQLANVPLSAGFSIGFPVMTAGEITIQFATRSGRNFTVPMGGMLVRNRSSTLSGPDGSTFRFRVEQLDLQGDVRRPRRLEALAASLEGALWVGYGIALLILTALGLLGLWLALWFAVPASVAATATTVVKPPPAGVLALLAAAILLRLATATVIDTFAWPVEGYRYLYPAMVLYGPLAILLLSQGIRTWLVRNELLEHAPRERLLVGRTGSLIRT
jgi:hypothetical protein